jgi:hypothetical protein
MPTLQGNHASDGFSLYTTTKETAAPDIFKTSPEDTSQNQGVLTFIAPSTFPDLNSSTQSIQLPLANTIFSTGRLSTMFATQWTMQSNILSVTSTHYLSAQRITLTLPNFSTSMVLPLTPLTSARKIQSSMGNIIRQISGPNSTNIPASAELEKAVVQYSQTVKNRTERFTVWACLYPHRVDPVDPSLAHHSSISEQLSSRFLAGARLHRVLSGGGGWGAKQGLLSLDPEQSFLEPETEGSDFDFTFAKGVRDIAGEEEQIQFFVATEPEHNAINSVANKNPGPGTHNTCAFGTCVPQEDSLINLDSSIENNENHPLITTIPNHFGALSEKGISIRYDSWTVEKEALRIGQTKLDVPYSNVRMTGSYEKDRGT